MQAIRLKHIIKKKWWTSSH